MFLAQTVSMTGIKYNLQKMKTYLKRSQGTVMIWQIMILWKLNLLCNQCLPPLLWVRTLLRWGVLDITLCDKVCQWLATGHHDTTEKLLKMTLNTINQTTSGSCSHYFRSQFWFSSNYISFYIIKISNEPKVRKPSCEHVDGQCLFLFYFFKSYDIDLSENAVRWLFLRS